MRIWRDSFGCITFLQRIECILQILRYGRTKHPRFDVTLVETLEMPTDWIPFQYVETATIRVDGRSHRIVAVVDDGASLIFPLVRRHRPAVVGTLDSLKIWVACEVVRNTG